MRNYGRSKPPNSRRRKNHQVEEAKIVEEKIVPDKNPSYFYIYTIFNVKMHCLKLYKFFCFYYLIFALIGALGITPFHIRNLVIGKPVDHNHQLSLKQIVLFIYFFTCLVGIYGVLRIKPICVSLFNNMILSHIIGIWMVIIGDIRKNGFAKEFGDLFYQIYVIGLAVFCIVFWYQTGRKVVAYLYEKENYMAEEKRRQERKTSTGTI